MSAALDDRFRVAARGYFVYGLVYLVGGFWLWLHDVGRGFASSAVWILGGAGLVVLIPFLLRRPRPWFERWILSRRDFARLVVLLMAFASWPWPAWSSDRRRPPSPPPGAGWSATGSAVWCS